MSPAQVTRDREVEYSKVPTVSKQTVAALHSKHHSPPYSQSDSHESAQKEAKAFFAAVLPGFKVPETGAFVVWLWENDERSYTAGISIDTYQGCYFSIGMI